MTSHAAPARPRLIRLASLVTALAALAASAPAQVHTKADHTAGAAPSRVAHEAPIQLENLPRLVVTLRGRILLDETGHYLPGGGRPAPLEGGLRGPGCPTTTSTHTDASFSGGSYVVQAGFAQTERAAASYVIPAAAFPARFESAEMIFATSNATVQTTTQWSITLYDGLPSTGGVLYTESSLDGILPPIILGPGTSGVSVQVVIDPGDPEQVYFTNAQGNNTISFAFRIDQHHNQTSNPCFTAPPTCCNAFPVTDTSGLASPSGNWLWGVNCGQFGCPSNGGWSTFGNLASFCRPTGDWVMRMRWVALECAPTQGACCLPNGTCQPLTQAQCTQSGGTYQGDNSNCGSVNCPQPTGACCFNTGGCLLLTQANCASAGGTWLGGGTACAAGNTCPTGACCLPSGDCDIRTQAACTAANGIYRGTGTTCATANCPPPPGACCLSNGGCLVLTSADCGVIPGSTWAGPGTTCPDACTGCAVDWNNDTLVNSADITAFLGDWIASIQQGTLVGDFNADGQVNSADITAFLGEWITAVGQGGC